MESRKRLFIAFSITLILLAALLTSFGRSFFITSTPQVTLPTLLNPTEEEGNSLLDSKFQSIELSKHTVQEVIAQLQSQENYYRSFSSTLYWGDAPEDSFVTDLELWAVGSVIQVKKTLPSGDIRYDILQDNWVYSWYLEEESYWTHPLQQEHLYQMIPSYQSILALDTESIHRAGYEYHQGIPCIYVEVSAPPLYFQECYWVQAETGLLVAAESYDQGQLVYRMEGFSPIIPYDSPYFSLPNGTMLHALETEGNFPE